MMFLQKRNLLQNGGSRQIQKTCCSAGNNRSNELVDEKQKTENLDS
jgi:hypothetical protein